MQPDERHIVGCVVSGCNTPTSILWWLNDVQAGVFNQQTG
jgi:hypothetical protein